MAISLEELESIVNEFLAEYKGPFPLHIEVVNHQEEAYGPRGTADRIGRAGGAYYPARGGVVLAAASLRDKAGARTTLRHEVLGHYGLNTLKPEDKFELLRKITHTRAEAELEDIWRHVDEKYPEHELAPLRKAEEVFAYVAERPQTFASECWTGVRAYFHKALRAVGLLKTELTAQELQHEANCIARSIRQGLARQRTIPETDDAQFRKGKRDPRQLTFTFDTMVDHIEKLRDDSASGDAPEKPAYGPNGILLGEDGQELSPPVLPVFDPVRLLAELKAQREQIERDAVSQGKLPVSDANLEERIARLERYFKEANPDVAVADIEKLRHDDSAYMEQMLRDGVRRTMVDAFAMYVTEKREQGITLDSKSLNSEFVGTAEWAAVADQILSANPVFAEQKTEKERVEREALHAENAFLLTITHLDDGRIAVSGPGISDESALGLLRIPGIDINENGWTFPGDQEEAIRALPLSLTPKIKRTPDGLALEENGALPAPEELEHILSAMTWREVSSLLARDMAIGTDKEMLVHQLVDERIRSIERQADSTKASAAPSPELPARPSPEKAALTLSGMKAAMGDRLIITGIEPPAPEHEESGKNVGQSSAPASAQALREAAPYVAIGKNSQGTTVYELREGGRMFSRNPAIMQTVDGEKNTPEALYLDKKHGHAFLTVAEVAAFKQQEASHDRRTDSAAGNRPAYSETRNHPGDQAERVNQHGLFDTGSLGAEHSGHAAGAGGGEHGETRAAAPAAWPAGGEGARSSDERRGMGDGAARDERLGDSGGVRDRHGTALDQVDWGKEKALGKDVAPRTNHRIRAEDNLGAGGARTKYADNIAAIKLLHELREQGAKTASQDEKKILARYVGWGGIPEVFDPRNDKWSGEYRDLRDLLSPDDYAKARRSTQDAHYTSETVIRAMYQGLARMGLKDGSPDILEPSAGIGNFIGLCPDGLTPDFTAVELDPTSHAIAEYLYPRARHVNAGFQHSGMFEPHFDAVIGNPPFGQQSLYDPAFTELRGFSIHNYFLAKSLRLVREGGVAAFVVSRYFMDAADASAREHIAGYADFLGAVRLPDSAFKRNALTEVTTDIVFFQKNSGRKRSGPDWIQTVGIQAEDLKNGGTKAAVVNQYFASRPDRIIGKMVYPASGGMYGDALTCEADPAPDLGHEIEKRLDMLRSVYVPLEKNTRAASKALNTDFIASEQFQKLKQGSLCVEPKSGKIVFKIREFGGDSYDFVSLKHETARNRLVSMIQVRDTLRELLNAEKTDADEGRIEEFRRRLNIRYESHVRRFGHLNSQTNRALMRDDPEHSLLESLETDYDKGLSADAARRQGRPARKPSANKAAIFHKRVLRPTRIAARADSAKDALVISLRETGRVDFDRMSRLLGRESESVRKELSGDGLIFRNPVSREWEIRDRYLTGNVREKLRAAREAAGEDASFQANADALADALPPDIEAVDIGIQFGSSWVPGEVISDFIDHLHGGRGRQHVAYIPALGKWDVKVGIYDSSINRDVWGIPEYPAEDILESLLTNRPIKVEKETGRDGHGRPVMVVDQELTSAAMAKADAIRREFLDWVWQDDNRRESLARLYNDRFNTHVPPRYDGSHVSLVNTSSAVTLRSHQKDVVWRGIQEGTALFDHVVGAGKTFAAIATMMESKRMGFLHKPMAVVPNHLIYQWRDDFFKLYPDANILVADKADFKKENRERFFSRVATGDWDAVIVPHSSFRKIDMPHDAQREILQEQIDMVIAAIEQSKIDKGSRATIKQLEKQREKMESRFEALLAGAGQKDKSVDFGDLGVDGLFVDESHEFKNLSYTTTMNVSGLGNITGSAKALDMFIKCRHLQKKHDGRGVYFMTGTPISNTIAEVYTLQRYMQYEELQAKDIEHFDAWASTFGQVTSGWELDATGVNYTLKSRFSSFQNVPELLSMYRAFADVVTKNDLDEQSERAGERPLTPPVEGGKPFNHVVDRSDSQSAYMDTIIHRMEHLPKDPSIDNPLKITNDARKAGLDYRLIDPEADDHPGSKVNAAVERIYDIWRDSAADRGTQLVFCDLSTPKGGFKPADKPVSTEPELFFEEGSPSDGDVPDAEPDMPDAADTMEAGDDGEDQTTAKFMDDAVVLTSRFSVYDDMKRKLIDKGIPADEIAFIHDANTDIRKSKLFADMQAGRVRILMGSTSKMGAGMNVQKKLVAAHHLDAPWRPSDLEQRNGRIIRQGNDFYERDPDNFNVGIYYYATKRTYDSRMWQTIEYKAAAIEQFRKGDLLQRNIEDVQSEAANAAEMKAAASGNPLILQQVKLASDLRKLEALYSQHQRSQHRLRDRLKWLASASERLDKAGAAHAADLERRDALTRMRKGDRGKERIKIELIVDGRVLGEKDEAAIKSVFVGAVKTARKEKRAHVGSYRGFEVYALRHYPQSQAEGFRFALKGSDDQEFMPENLIYNYDDKLSMSGWFQRLDNFLDKGLEQSFQTYKGSVEREIAELATVRSALGQEFGQKDELALTRENHAAVMRELKRMQDEPGYVSTWEPEIEPHPEKRISALPANNERCGSLEKQLPDMSYLPNKARDISNTQYTM